MSVNNTTEKLLYLDTSLSFAERAKDGHRDCIH